MTKWVVVLIAILVVAALAYAQWTSGVPVLAAAAEQGPIREFIDERGITRLPKTYLITMPYTGRLEGIELEEGQRVARGDHVARLVPSDLQLAVDAATAAVERLDAAIRENDDQTVETTGLQQAIEFVRSMNRTVEAALARVESGRAKKDFAERHFGRIKSLADTRAVTDEEVDRAELAMVQSGVDYRQDELVHRAMVALQAATALMPTMIQQYIDRKSLSRDVLVKQRAEAAARLAQVQQDQHRGTLDSPVDGVVLARHITNERYISAGQELIEIGRLADLEVEADVLSHDVVRVKRGDDVEVYGPAVGSQAARGSVVRVFPAGFTKISSLGVEQQRVKVIIRIDPDDLQRLIEQRGLGVDYRVRVKIFTADEPDATIIPRSALFRGSNGDWQVYAIRGGIAQLTTIQVGLMNDNLVQVVKGLEVGQTVVLAPEVDLADGLRVEVSE